MADQAWFCGQCPKCFKRIRAAQPGHEDAVNKMLWHLSHSEKHPMSDEEALQFLDEHPDSIWEDGEGTWEEKEVEEEKPKPRLRSRSRSRGRSDARSHDKGHQDRSKHWQKGSGGHGKSQAIVHQRGKGSSSSMSWRDQAIVERTTELVISNVVTEQQEKVFQFAKTLGKCQAVIQTAARVARQCVSAFEDGVHNQKCVYMCNYEYMYIYIYIDICVHEL
jgi:hypothetical protein